MDFEQKLEDEGYTPRLENRFMPVEHYLEKYGWERQMLIVDTEKLLPSYYTEHAGNMRIKNWFNGSIVIFEGKRYMAYRIDTLPWTVNTKIAFCEMDDSWQPVKETNWMVQLKSCAGFWEDPRLFIHQGKLHMSYADGCQIGIALIDPVKMDVTGNYMIDKPLNFRMEKNWLFFTHQDQLHAVYQLFPHVVYQVNGPVITNKTVSQWPMEWKWGKELRGSTCPVLVDDLWYSFFHSHIEYPVEMKGFLHRQYHLGCYVFENKPPFKVVAMSKEPVISGTYIDPTIPHGGHHNYCFFAMTALFSSRYLPETRGSFLISGGVNDYRIGMFEITMEELKANLRFF